MERKHKPKVNFYKSDVYSFGMILLEAGTLHSSNSLYDFDNGIVNEIEMSLRCSVFGVRYGKKLEKFLRKLLIKD